MTYPEPDKELEKLIHDRLRALPELEAPKELVPAVLQRLAAQRARAWWQRPWSQWPPPLRLLVLLLVAAPFAGLAYVGLRHFNGLHPQGAGGMAGVWQVLGPLLKALWMVADAVVLLLQAIKPVFVAIAATSIILLYLLTVGLGTLFYRVTTGKT